MTPELHMLPPNATVEQVVALYKKLTGKEPTPEEIDELKAQAVMGERSNPPIQVDAELANADWPKRTKDVQTPRTGFTLSEVLVVIAVIFIIAALVVAGVSVHREATAATPTSYSIGQGGFHVIKIDGCEYIAYSEGFVTSESRVYTFTHKGNCSNAIHKYNTEQP